MIHEPIKCWEAVDFEKLLGKPWQAGQIWFKNDLILNATEHYVLASCHTVKNVLDIHDNPVTEQMFKKWPHADIYKDFSFTNLHTNAAQEMTYKHIPTEQVGTIKSFGNGKDQRYIINMFTREFPGRPVRPSDGHQNRLSFFLKSMEQVYKTKNLTSVAMQENFIGTEYYAEPDYWKRYLSAIEKFAVDFPKVQTVVYVTDVFLQMKSKLLHKAITQCKV